MPRPCSICANVSRAEIDAAILASVPNRRIASQYGFSEAAVRRHKDGHLRREVQAAAERAGGESILRADALLTQLATLQRETLALLEQAKGKDVRTALAAVREVRGNLHLLSDLLAADELERRLDALERELQGVKDGKTTTNDWPELEPAATEA